MNRIQNTAMLEALLPIKREIRKQKTKIIVLPKSLSFKSKNIMQPDRVLELFNWELSDVPVKIDLRPCTTCNYQALSLVVLYCWYLKNKNCVVEIILDDQATIGASFMWKNLGALSTFPVLLDNQQFKSRNHKPLFALRRNSQEFGHVLNYIENYTSNYDISYNETLQYVLSELMYNTMEHGYIYSDTLKKEIPSIVQLCWYQTQNEIQIIIADIGIGIKDHIKQTYKHVNTDEEALMLAIQPEKSGTFARTDPYQAKNNAGMGLYLSSNIIRKLNAEMYLISGNGLLHISPRDITTKTLEKNWKGTIALISVKIDSFQHNLSKILQELRYKAEQERNRNSDKDVNEYYVVYMSAFFGDYAERKEEAIKHRDQYILPQLALGKTITFDFENIKQSPHSFLNALLATPIQRLGIQAFKKLKFINTPTEIRETIDFILEDNT